MEILVGDTLYFSAMMEAAAQNCGLMIPQTPQLGGWLISTADLASSHPGQWMAEILVGDTLYFDADDGSSGKELWAHDTSNASTWRVADIDSGSGEQLPRKYMAILVGDTLYFSANDGSSGTNCGLMIPQTPQLGGWLISTADLAAVTPEIHGDTRR